MLQQLRPRTLKKFPKIPIESPSMASVQSVTWSSKIATKRSATARPPAETMYTRSALTHGLEHSRKHIKRPAALTVVMIGLANGCTCRDDGHWNEWYFKGARCKNILCFASCMSTKTSLTFDIADCHLVTSNRWQ
jgi:hypothetical protein